MTRVYSGFMPVRPSTRQLDAQDAWLLQSDLAHANANVSLLHIYNQATATGGAVRFKDILAHIDSRLDRLPHLRQKLQRVPLDLDLPYWVDDENFDLEYHVRHIALPKPGDWRQFCIQVSRIHARALDLGRPLWEIYVIEGLDTFLDLPAGSFALVTKMHHAAIDIDCGSELTMLLHDIRARAAPPAPAAPWFADEPPSTLPILARSVWKAWQMPLRMGGPVGRVLRRLVPAAHELTGDALRPAPDMPMTRFNSVVSPYRVFETRRFKLQDIRAIRALVPGSTVHDVVLAISGGALRRYLDANLELPATSLHAAVPLYVRAPGAANDARPGLDWTRVELGTDIADPAARLAHIRAQVAASRRADGAVAARELVDVQRHAPGSTLALAGKQLGRAVERLGRSAPLANCAIANVPGPDVPLYLCGARMTYSSAIMPIADGMGLVFAVTSYDGMLVISPTSCRELLPDPEAFAQCLRDSFQELLGALHRAPAPRRSKAKAAPTPASRRPPSGGRRRPTRPAA
jgi:WS/DGAT/MGAT family acyltransferase